MTATAERKYALTKIKAGDYLLPSNDATIIWRLERYIDGPSHGLDWPKDRKLWQVWRWTGQTGPSNGLDVADWDRWELVVSCLPTRAAAIEAALQSPA